MSGSSQGARGRNGVSARPAHERLRELVEVDALSGCHNWMGSLDKAGYGRIKDGVGSAKRTRRVHKVSYEAINGAVPDGLVLDHLCRNRRCCNPAHLEAVTQRTNTLRGNTRPAAQAKQTHCKHGHPFTAENTYFKKHGHRQCRLCKKQLDAARNSLLKKRAREELAPEAPQSAGRGR